MSIEIVAPHRKQSRNVVIEDRDRVLRVAEDMRNWMNSKYDCVGLAHPQVDDVDPLRFFIALQEPNRVILNPVIVHASSVLVPSKEGCMTYQGKEHIYHDRHMAIKVEYEVFKSDRMVKKTKLVTGFLALVYQHEIDHLNGIYCYDGLSENKEQI